MLVFKQVSKHYPDGTAALHGISLEIPAGQFCVVLGPSGAGKSTLLRMVNGLAIPSSGSTTVDGVPVTPKTLAQVRARVAMIHQLFNLVPRASVALNVLSGATPAVPTWRVLLELYPEWLRRKACDLIAEVGLGAEHLQRRVNDLSGGQQQRVGIARAFMLDPAVVLADEPVASLDPRISREILMLLRDETHERRATVLCSLHQVDLAQKFADRVIALNAGRVVFDGAPSALKAQALEAIYAGREPCCVPAPLMSRPAVAHA